MVFLKDINMSTVLLSLIFRRIHRNLQLKIARYNEHYIRPFLSLGLIKRYKQNKQKVEISVTNSRN